MAIAYQTSATSNNNAGTCNKPSGTVSGDLLVATLQVGNTTATITPASGWTSIQKQVVAATGCTIEVFYRVAGGSEPSSYSFTASPTAWTDTGIFRYDGEDTASAFDVSSSNADGSTGTSHVTPSITTARDGNLVAAGFFDLNAAFGASTPPAGMTQRALWDNANAWNDVVQATAGSTGTKTETTTGAARTANIIASFQAPDTGPPPPPIVTSPVTRYVSYRPQ